MSTGTIEPLLLLLLATILPFASVLAPKLGTRTPLWLRVLWDAAVLLALTFLVQPVFGSPLDPQFGARHTGELIWQQLVEAGWWIMAGRLAVGVARALVVLENRPRETQIVSDLLAGAVYVATFLAIVNFALSVPIRGLLATSGVIAIVLGLALQSTLSDVFSGIAVGIEKPYSVGDMLWVEGGIEGRVMQVNWRSTLIATLDGNVAVVPNSVIAKARLVNRSAPTPIRGQTMQISLDSTVAPERCVAALSAAMRACNVPLAPPPPSVVCRGLRGDGAAYEVGFSVPSGAELDAAWTEIVTLVHRHLRFDGIALAVAGLAASPLRPPTPQEAFEQSDLFGMIEPGQCHALAGHLTPVWLQPGETLIRQGETAGALFVIASGAAEVSIESTTGRRVVARMSPGETLGAVGLITGSSYGATATALTPLKAYRLDRADIAAAVKASPELGSALDALAQRGLAVLRRDAAAHEDAKLTPPEVFRSRLRTFLRLLNA